MDIEQVKTYSRAFMLVECVSRPQRSPTDFRSADLARISDFSRRLDAFYTCKSSI